MYVMLTKHLDPAVYPHFELYPAKPLAVGTTREISVKLEARYPIFGICKLVEFVFLFIHD